MVWSITALTFIVSLVILLALVWAFTPGETQVSGRLSRILDTRAPEEREEKFTEKQMERARDALASIGKLMPAASSKGASRAQLMMIRAGYHSPNAVLAIRAMKLLTPALLLIIVLAARVYTYSPFFILVATLGLGFLLPEMWLGWRIRARQRLLRQGLPDAMDLLVICVEVGLGLDQALVRVAQELRIVHPELSDELQMRVGKTRIEALRELARRTGLDDIKALVAMLIQTERFGTSVAQSLRIHSDELRVKRRQRAEELSAKTTVKMVFPLIFFVFPALMVVILGPAVITLIRQFTTTLH
jgi:tight adherence protein C